MEILYLRDRSPFCSSADDIFGDTKRTYIGQRPYKRGLRRIVEQVHHVAAPAGRE